MPDDHGSDGGEALAVSFLVHESVVPPAALSGAYWYVRCGRSSCVCSGRPRLPVAARPGARAWQALQR